jgi:hypothetical protein
VVEPAHGLGDAGIGDVIIGLTPALSISVAPSGMPLPDGALEVVPPIYAADPVPAALPDPHDPDGVTVAKFGP